MKNLRPILFMLLVTFIFQPAKSQNKKFDKSIRKIDAYYDAGSLPKASSTLKKLKSSVVKKMGKTNPYMPGLFMREAKINLASGILVDFDKNLEEAISASLNAYGETSTKYATTMLDVAIIYNEYGNFRIARDYIEKAKAILSRTDQIDEGMAGRIALVEAETLIGQGFSNDAIALLEKYEKYFLTRAVEKETYVENNEIKSRRVPEEELFERFNSYAKLKTLQGSAFAQKGRISYNTSHEEPDVDRIFLEFDSWLKGKRKYFGETSLADVHYRFVWSKAFSDNGSVSKNKDLNFDNILGDLKKKTNPTNSLAHEIYLNHLAELLRQDNYPRYQKTKFEYQKVIDKYYPKSSLHVINLKAVEFNSKLSRDRTKDLEKDALALLSSKALPKNYKTSTLVLKFLYDIAISEKNYKNAESYLQQIVDTKKELCGETSPEYHLAKLSLANFFLDYTNKVDEAGKIYGESYSQIVEKQIAEQHKDLLEILNHIAQWYEMTDNYAAASKTLHAAQLATQEKFYRTDVLYAKELEKIAELQLKIGDYEGAEANLLKGIEIIDDKDNKDFLERKPIKVSLLETQAKLYGIKGMFDEAENSLDDSNDIIRKDKDNMYNVQSTAEELTPLFIQLGRFSEADKLLRKQIPEYERLFGFMSLRLIEPLVNKSQILLAKGDYTEAERTALRANQIAVKTYSEISTKAAPTQRVLSDIYYTLGDYDKAETEIVKALKSQEKQFGRNHIEVAKSLSQLALIKFHKKDNTKAIEKLLLEARDITVAKLGKENPQYAEILKNMAVLYISENKFDIAFNNLTNAETIWRTKTGTKNNINAASIYTLTGDVYYQLKNYKKAEEFYGQSKSLYEKFFSVNHPEYVKVLSKMAKVYYMQKDYKRSKRYIEEALDNYEAFIKLFFPALSEREKAKYWNTIKGDFEFYNTLAFSNLEDFKDLTGKVYNYQLLTKALLLSSSIKIRERIQNSTDEDLKAQYNNWVQKKEMLTLALSMSPVQLAENLIDPVALSQEVERLEKELSQKSEIFGQSFDSKRITFEEVKKSIKPNEVAIEMVRYRHFHHTFTDSVIYAAIYVRNELSKPKVIMLKDGKNMETRFFKYYRNSIIGKIPDEYSYNIFWKPIHDGLGQAATIYLSADGIYNQINLEAIPTPDGRFIIDNSNIILVSNTKDLFLRRVKSRPKNSENTASMFGNPTFYLADASNRRVAALPGTEREVDQVQFMLKQKGWLTAEFVEKTATEENVKELNSPKIFHIATHGFYRPGEDEDNDLQENEAALTRNPLLRTGLLLKGAGDLMNKTEHNYNIENGILTAYEAMSLNLDKTDLVVLSACETGLGDLEAGEGVYGLQRAFLVAGAKVLIMSMFKVDDEATQKLMLKFYQKWLNTGNLRESFTEAKKELRTDYPEPIYWGAFIMIGLE
ncbi:MAG TPA: CHAT domain-containing tetratricopeptide repeat protein [Ohtaekwangia sp.]|nr:CHAT domain-containing tetratricopeptide repeat protein [Ohtaekwangia sp.]